MALRVIQRSQMQRMSYCFLTAKAKDKATEKTDKIKIESKVQEDVNYDWIGPPDPESNIRPIKFRSLEDETDMEKKFHVMSQKTHEWNQKFWANHNKAFFKEKESFAQKRLAELKMVMGENAPKTLSQDDMVVFYKDFLDKNYKMHMKYNSEWYERNVNLLQLAFKVSTGRLKKKFLNWKLKK